MSKSLGNFFLLRDILEKYSPQVVRFYLLSTHYRSQLDFDDEKLNVAAKGLERLETAYRLLKETMDRDAGEDSRINSEMDKFAAELDTCEQRFVEAMDDDFNTALAIAVLFDLARAINGFTLMLNKDTVGSKEKALLEKAESIYLKLGGIIGLIIGKQEEKGDTQLTKDLIELLIKIRKEAKVRKDFQTADSIRDELKKLGVVLEDTHQGVRWKINR
jgi:cysteinyl-tRNA synthetase